MSFSKYNTLFEHVNFLIEKTYVKQEIRGIAYRIYEKITSDIPGIIHQYPQYITYTDEFIKNAEIDDESCMIDTHYMCDANMLMFFPVNSSRASLLKKFVTFDDDNIPHLIKTPVDDYKSLKSKSDYRGLNLLHPVCIKLEYKPNSFEQGSVVRPMLVSEEEYNSYHDFDKTEYVNTLMNDPIWIVLNVADKRYRNGRNLMLLIEDELTQLFYIADKRKRFIEPFDFCNDNYLIDEYELIDETSIKNMKAAEYMFNICKYYLSAQERQARMSSTNDLLNAHFEEYQKWIADNPDILETELMNKIFEHIINLIEKDYIVYPSLYKLLKYCYTENFDNYLETYIHDKDKQIDLLYQVVSFKLMILKKLNLLKNCNISNDMFAYYICKENFSKDELNKVHNEISNLAAPFIKQYYNYYVDYVSKIQSEISDFITEQLKFSN